MGHHHHLAEGSWAAFLLRPKLARRVESGFNRVPRISRITLFSALFGSIWREKSSPKASRAGS
jgi:hypothetical protein